MMLNGNIVYTGGVLAGILGWDIPVVGILMTGIMNADISKADTETARRNGERL